jgi:hypothetical protein
MKKFLLAIFGLVLISLIPCRAETIIALYSNNRLRYFDSANPDSFTKTVNLTGIPATEAVAAMDFHPTGKLYVVTLENSVIAFYEVDPNSGVAIRRTSFPNWSGTASGFDFLPGQSGQQGVLVNEADQFKRVNPPVGGGPAPVTMAYDNTTSDGDPVDQHAGDNPAITALASSNNFPEAKSTVLYGIDAGPNSLVIVNQSTGQLNTVGPLGAATGTRCGFDISGTTGVAYAALGSGDSTTLYTVDLGSGAATSVGPIGGQFQQVGVTVVDIAALAPTRLLNISTRTRVGTGEDVMIAGFTTVGGATSRLLIRGLGPSLAAFGIASPLPDPYLTVNDANGVIATNDNWKSDQQSGINSTGLPPTNDLEAAYLGNFAPGAYTAILRDANNATGVGVIEVYKLSDQ